MILVDDHLLAVHLGDSRAVAPGSVPLATTCSWWWRLAAALGGDRGGALSRIMDPLEPGTEPTSTLAVERVRDEVTVLDLRDLIPNMARVAARYRLNLLAAEALVAADALGADIVVGQDTPRLREAARVRGITYLVEA